MPVTQEAQNYPVEVSGWDTEQTFFVEKTVLHWQRDKRVCLRRHVAPGAILFIRLVDLIGDGNAQPIAYQVQSVSPPDPRGLRFAEVLPMQPRATLGRRQAFPHPPPGIANE